MVCLDYACYLVAQVVSLWQHLPLYLLDGLHQMRGENWLGKGLAMFSARRRLSSGLYSAYVYLKDLPTYKEWPLVDFLVA